MPEFLLRQRWYPAKDAGRPEVSVRALEPIAVPGIPAAAGVWRVQPPGRAPLHLFVAVALVPEDSADPSQVIARLPATGGEAARVLVEGFSSDAFTRAWVAMLLHDTPVGAGTRLRSGRTAQLEQAGLRPDGQWRIRRSSAEQSNTSIRIDDGAIMKAIRKLEEGTHPELEVGRFLTGEGAFAGTPAMLAWADLELPAQGGTATYTLCVMQSFVANQGDAWEWMLRKLAAATDQDDAALAQASAWLERLGERTAQMHRAFGTASQDPDFVPEPVRDEDLRGWTAAVHEMAQRVLERLDAAGQRLDATAQALSKH